MKQQFKRVLSLLLVVCLLCTGIPSVLAAEGDRFTDVAENHWAYSAIYEAVDAGYFSGISDTEFAPEGVLTRAMLVSIMARASGAELDNSQTTEFSDVPAGTWYTGAVIWASQNGVVYGDGDGSFAPGRPATRQETAAIFYRFLKHMGKTLEQKEAEKKFADQKDIAAWAAESVKAMQMAGVLSGYPDGTFQPQSYLTRAEAASLLVRFMKGATDPAEPTEPTEPGTEPEEEPIHVTFVTEHTDVVVEGKTVTEVTLPLGVDFVEFIARAQEGYEVYDVTASGGRMSQTGSNFVVAGLTEDVTITITDGVVLRTVTFNANNGTEAVQVKVPNGETVAQPADPVKEDDSFLGWHAASGEKWDFATPVTANMTLFAYWLNDTYVGATVYLDPINGKDDNDGLTADMALKTFEAAAAKISPKVTEGVIWVLNTVTVTDSQTWDLTGRDCVVKRAPSCTANMIQVNGGSLTLKGVTIDGNSEKVKTNKPIYINNDGTVTLEEGTVVRNCYGSTHGGAFYLDGGSNLIMNGGKITDNTANYAGGAIYLNNSDAAKCATFIMNGGVISGNTAGSMGAAVCVSGSKAAKIELNGGVIEKNTVNSANANAAAVSTSDYTALQVGGVAIRDNYGSSKQSVNAIYTSAQNVTLVPTAETELGDAVYLNNRYASSKTITVMVPEGLAKLQGKLSVRLEQEFVGARVLSGGTGEGAYTLQQSDVDKIQMGNDIEGAYCLAIDAASNTVQFVLPVNHDIVVYVNGSSGKDDNDGLSTSSAVKTLDKAKEVLKAQIAAAGEIPEDAQFVISVVGRLTVNTDTTLTFADFGDNASRCILRRDATNTMGYMIQVTDGAKVTVDHMIIDGNKGYLKSGVSSVFDVAYGAQLTAESGLEVRNFIFNSNAGVFQTESSMDQAVIIVNGGWYHDLTGYAGVFVYGSGTGISDQPRPKVVVNDCLVENITGTYGTILAYKAAEVEIHAGTFRNITMSNEVGQLAALVAWERAQDKAYLTICPAAEGKTLSYEGCIWLANTVMDDYGSLNKVADCYVGIGGAMNQDIVVDGSMMMWGTTVAAGVNGYKLTEDDMAHISVVSGDVLTLNTKTNTISIAKVR